VIGPYNDVTRSVLRAGNTLLGHELYSGLYSRPLLCSTLAGQVNLCVLEKMAKKAKRSWKNKKEEKSTNRKKDNKCEKRQKGEVKPPSHTRNLRKAHETHESL